jgi:hypothetical protein
MNRSVSICLALVVLTAIAAQAEALVQRMGAVTGTEVALSTTASKAVVRQSMAAHLRQGANRLTFSWSAEKIDAASVRLQAAEGVTVGESIRQAGADKSLAWDVFAPAEGDYALTMTYLLDGLAWSPSYRLLYQPGVGEARLEGLLTLTNDSGLLLEGAVVSLTLGRSGDEPVSYALPDLGDLPIGSKVRTGFLSPLALRVRAVHRLDGERAAESVRQVLVVTPPAEGGLAQEALPAGPVSIVLLTEDGLAARSVAGKLAYTPGEEFELDLGVERDIVVERVLLDRSKQNLDFDRLGRVAGFDTIERYEIRIRNHCAADVQLEIVETVLDTWDFSTRELYARDLDEGVAVVRLVAPVGEERVLQFTMVKHSGTRIPK